jgi:thiosulfate/3-mercaptopyruvate sulfurtransferase
MEYTTLIEPSELAPHLADPGWVVVDCRFDLGDPAAGSGQYAEAHIPGARYAHLDADMSGPVTARTGRHPLPDPGVFARKVGAWGIAASSQVVAYDAANGAVAARLWWTLRWLGHRKVAVLNGGLRAWIEAGQPLSDRAPVITPVSFTPRVVPRAAIDVEELAGRLTAGSVLLIDARSGDRFAGKNETIDPVAGHVPGARNHPFLSNVDAGARFLAKAELRERWRTLLAEASGREVVCMCGSGVTACHNLLALEVAGLGGGRLYAGSWSEWIRDERRPVEQGG